MGNSTRLNPAVPDEVGAIDAAALGPFKKQATDEKSLLSFGCDFSG